MDCLPRIIGNSPAMGVFSRDMRIQRPLSADIGETGNETGFFLSKQTSGTRFGNDRSRILVLYLKRPVQRHITFRGDH